MVKPSKPKLKKKPKPVPPATYLGIPIVGEPLCVTVVNTIRYIAPPFDYFALYAAANIAGKQKLRLVKSDAAASAFYRAELRRQLFKPRNH